MNYITYKLRAYPNKSQQQFFFLNFTMCRLMFNTLLSLVLENYRAFYAESEISSPVDQSDFNRRHKLPSIASLKKVDNRYKLCDSLALLSEYKHLMRGFELFFNGSNSKLPHYKGRKDTNSYTTSCVNNNIRVIGNKVKLPKIPPVKVRGMREIPSNFTLKQARVFEDKSGRFYIYLIFSYPSDSEATTNSIDPNENIDTSNINPTKTVGLDFKIGDVFVSSDNFLPKYSSKYYALLDKLPFVQNNVNRKCKFSKNYWKSVIKLRRFHRNIVNIRHNFLHHISSFLASNYDLCVIENLSIIEIVHKLGRGKNAYNTSFNFFVKLLRYKTNVAIIDKWFPSSKKCSCCGKKKKHLKLSQRTYNCQYCGNSIDRDLNAAINIRNEGLRILNLI